MKLDLDKFNCIGMRVIAHAPLEPSHIKNIKAKYKMFLSANYVIEKAGYRLNALLISPRPPIYHIEISYSKTREKREEEQKMRTIQELFNYLSPVLGSIMWKSRVAFKYKRGPGLYIPVLKFPMQNLPIDEIRGIRFVKLDGKKVSYSIIIDSPENKEIYHSISFEMERGLSLELPKEVLERAVEISKMFI